MGDNFPEHGNASSCHHFGPHSEWKYIWQLKYKNKSCQLATNRLKKNGKMSKIYQSLDKLSMNYPLVNASDTFISYVTIWCENIWHFLTMEGARGREL